MTSVGDRLLCENCGNFIGEWKAPYGPLEPPSNAIRGGSFSSKYFCCKRCKEEWKERKEAKSSSDNSESSGSSYKGSGSNQRGGGFFGSIISAEIDADAQIQAAKMSMTPEQIRAKAEVEAQERKEAEEANKQFYDSTKKFFGSTMSKIMPGKFSDKAKEAFDLHKRLQDLEVDIKICFTKNDIEKALELIKQLKHESTYLVDGTTTKYSDYWEQKRQDYLNKI